MEKRERWMVIGVNTWFTYHIFEHKSEIVDGMDNVVKCHNISVF